MQSLNEELMGNDLPAILKEMEEEEVSGYDTLLCDIALLTILHAIILSLTILSS